MQAAFYATPIIYPLTVVVLKSKAAAQVLLMSPVAQAIQDARYSLITHQTITVSTLFGKSIYVVIPLAIVVFVFIGGMLYFRKNSKYFAENI
jgi:ABC-2 type transport system permease protein